MYRIHLRLPQVRLETSRGVAAASIEYMVGMLQFLQLAEIWCMFFLSKLFEWMLIHLPKSCNFIS